MIYIISIIAIAALFIAWVIISWTISQSFFGSKGKTDNDSNKPVTGGSVPAKENNVFSQR